MPVPANPMKAALREGRVQIGLWQSLGSAYTAEICATAGFDWLLLDGEHGPNTITTLLAQLQAVAPYASHPVGRVPVGATHTVKQYLDIGFTSLLIPMVDDAAQAAEMVRAVRYPPDGVRGVGSGVARASRWNRISGYLDGADAEICLLVQVETRAGLANLDAIARTEGVDGVFIGPSDLSAALGHRGRPDHPDVQAAIEGAVGTIRAAGKAAGILSADKGQSKRYLELGFTFVAVGTDVTLLSRGALELAREFKGEVAAAPAAPSVY